MGIGYDYSNLYTSYLPIFSSNWNNGSNTGTFQLNVNNSTANANSNIATHLMFSNVILIAMALAKIQADPNSRTGTLAEGLAQVKHRGSVE